MDREEAQATADMLHDAEEAERALANKLPEGPERDARYMLGEHLSDQAWAIEEANDIKFRPSGLWKDHGYETP